MKVGRVMVRGCEAARRPRCHKGGQEDDEMSDIVAMTWGGAEGVGEASNERGSEEEEGRRRRKVQGRRQYEGGRLYHSREVRNIGEYNRRQTYHMSHKTCIPQGVR